MPRSLSTTASAAPAQLKVFGAFATPIEEPWDGVIHAALTRADKAGQIDYTFTDDIGYSGNMERVLRQVAGKNKPAIIFGDAFGNEEAVRRVAKAFPKIAFVFGSGGGPAEPNFSVFDNWIHEPAYLLGVMAGSLTKTNRLGIVAGLPGSGGEPPRERVHLGRALGEQEGGRQGHVHQQLVRSGDREGGRAGADRRARRRDLRRAGRRDRGRQAEEHHRLREHVRPEVDRAARTSSRARSGT